MKHIDIKKFAEKKTCIVLTTILFIILSILYIAGYIDINKRFPKPKEELYETGQYIEYKNRRNSAEGYALYGVAMFVK